MKLDVIKVLIRALEYIRVLGVVSGITTFGKLALLRGMHAVSVPGYSGPIWLRGKTSDRVVFEHVIVRRGYAIPEYARTPSTILDGGANVGVSTAFFANRYPDARILAVEPDADNYALLRRNRAPYPNVTYLHGALWCESGSVVIANPTDHPSAYQTAKLTAETGVMIRACTMDEIIHEFGGRLELAKLDIEGAELALFGAENLAWVASVEAFMIETHDRLKPGSSQAIYRAIREWDFEQHTHEESILILRR